MGNYGWISGTQRFTNVGGVLGRQALPKRVFFITSLSLAGSATVVHLYNGESAADSANIYASFYGTASSANQFDVGEMYMPNGCYVAVGSSTSAYVTVQYHEDK
jgi:hypothetical protein